MVLLLDGTVINNSKDKAMSVYFYSEDLTHLPSYNDLSHPVISDIKYKVVTWS